MPTTHSVALPGFPAPLDRYDRENEAQFRHQLERALLEQVAYIERLIQDPASVSTHVLASNTALGVSHTINGGVAGAVLRASSATAANLQRLTAADIDPGTFPAGSYVFQGAVSTGALTATSAVLGTDPGGSRILRVGAEIQLPNNNAIAFKGSAGSVDYAQIYLSTTDVLTHYLNGAARTALTAAAFSPATAGGLTLGTVSLPWGDIFTNSIISINAVGYIRSTAGILQLQSGTTGIDIRDSTNAETRTRFTNAGELWHGVISGSGQTSAMFETKGRAVVRRDGVATPGIWYENVLGYEQFVGQKSETHVGIWNTFWGIWVDRAQLVETAIDFKIGSLGRFDSAIAPATDQLLSFDSSVSKWRPRTVQLTFNSGVMVASALGDGSQWVGANSNPSLLGTPAAPTAAPVVTPVYGGFIVDMSATVLPANTVYVLDYSKNAGAYTSGAIIATSGKVVHQIIQNNTSGGAGTSTDTFAYKFKLRGASDSAYSPASTAQSFSTKTEVNAYGLIAAAQIACVNLAAVVADLGVVGAGRVQDSLSSPTNAIRFSSGYSLPSGLRVYWDMPNKLIAVNDGTYDRVKLGLIGSFYGQQWRDGSGNLTLDTASSDGRLKLQVGKSTALAPVAQLIYQNFSLSTTSTSEVTLATYAMPANTLGTNGDAIRITVVGEVTGADVNNLIRVYFDGGVVNFFDTTKTDFYIIVTIIRTGSSAQRLGSHTLTQNSVVSGVISDRTANLAASINIDFKARAAGGGFTTTIKQVLVEYLGV